MRVNAQHVVSAREAEAVRLRGCTGRPRGPEQGFSVVSRVWQDEQRTVNAQ